jgi:D-alanyl-D-alanine carboxypeptidase (penicillin-binding protein 5/6)
VKTGSSTAAGGCFVFFAHGAAAGREVSVVGAVLGQRGSVPVQIALDEGSSLVRATFASLGPQLVAQAGLPLGQLVTKWGATTSLAVSRNLDVLGAPGMTARSRFVPDPSGVDSGVARGTPVGQLVVYLGTQRVSEDLVASRNLAGPSLLWRLTNF